jgi:predicted oxidoreductase
VVIAWVMRHPSAPLPILGSRRISVAREAMAAQGLQLDDAAWWRICAAAAGPALA